MKRLINLIFLLTFSVSIGQGLHVGILAQANAGPTVSYSMANAGMASNVFHAIDKTASGVNGEPETIEVANGDFWIAPSGTAYRYTFTDGDVSGLTKQTGTWDSNQSRNLLHWQPDGLALYTANFAENVIGYTGGTVPFSETGRTYLGNMFNLTAQDSDGRGYAYNSDGTKIWMLGVVNNTIYEYDLVPAYTGSSSVTLNSSFALTGISSAPAGLDISPDENYMIFGNRGDDSITSISLTTNGTLSGGASLDSNINLGWWTTTIYNLKYSEDGRYIYALDTALDQIKQIDLNNQNTLGAEIITNGGFDSDTGWSKGTGWSISAGTANHDGTATSNINQSFSLTAGNWYLLTWDCVANVANVGSNAVEITAQTGYSGIRMYDHTMEVQSHALSFKADATATSSIQIYGRSGIAGFKIDNVSLKQITNK